MATNGKARHWALSVAQTLGGDALEGGWIGWGGGCGSPHAGVIEEGRGNLDWMKGTDRA